MTTWARPANGSREDWREVTRQAWPVRELLAFRCPACSADYVTRMRGPGDDWPVLVDWTGQAALF